MTRFSQSPEELIDCIKAAWNAIGKTPVIEQDTALEAVVYADDITFEPIRYGVKKKSILGEKEVMVNGWHVWTEFPHPLSTSDPDFYYSTEAYEIGTYPNAMTAARAGLMFAVEYAINQAVGLETK